MEIYLQGLDLIQTWSEHDKDRGRGLLAAAQIYGRVCSVYYEWNDLAAAEIHADRTREIYELGGNTAHGMRDYQMLAGLKHAVGDVDGAQSELRNLDRLIAKVGGTVTEDKLLAEKAAINFRLLLEQNHPGLEHLLSDVPHWVETRHLNVDDEVEYVREGEYFILARLLIAQARSDEAISVLEGIVDAAESADRMGDVITYLATLASAQTVHDDIDSALATLARALTLAEPEGYVRTFVDCGKPMQGLLQRAVDQNVNPEYATRLLKAFPSDTTQHTQNDRAGAVEPPTEALPNSQVERLNVREAALLKFMAAGMSNSEIAGELFISVNTVRWHAHNLFGKLGVNRRYQAVARARELRLI